MTASARAADPRPPTEQRAYHTRILRCSLEVEHCRAYWQHADGQTEATAPDAFAGWWFGARSLARVEVLIADFKARFDPWPGALPVLHRWVDMPPDIRPLVCHWHVQLADRLYRDFTGELLVDRRAARGQITRDLIVDWVEAQAPGRWSMTTRIQFASKLLSTALTAGLIGARQDPRPLTLPRVPDRALAYLMYLLRPIEHTGTALDNPYARSIGLDRDALTERLRALPGLRFGRQGDLTDLRYDHPDLGHWADAMLGAPRAEARP